MQSYAALREGDLLYFASVNYTTLGYGDILPHGDLRLLAGLEALNGMLLIGCPLEKARQIADDVVRKITDYRFVWKDKIFNIGVSVGLIAALMLAGCSGAGSSVSTVPGCSLILGPLFDPLPGPRPGPRRP